MASPFVKGFMSGVLDEGTDRMKGRDEAYEAMVEQTLNIIPQAMAAKNKLEDLRKQREIKAKQVRDAFRIPLGAAKTFLNEYDPDNTETILELRNTFQQLQLNTDQAILDNYKTTPTKQMPAGFVGSPTPVTLPTQKSTGFDALFGRPTIEDAISGAEERLNLAPGTGRDAINYATPVNIGPDPLRFETTGAYSFIPESQQVVQATLKDEELLLNNYISSVGGTITAAGTYEYPNIVLGQGDSRKSFKPDDASYAELIQEVAVSGSDITRHRRNYLRLTREEQSGAAELRLRDNAVSINAAIGEAVNKFKASPTIRAAIVGEDGNIDLNNFDYTTKKDPTGELQQAFLDIPEQGIPYEYLFKNIINNDATLTQNEKTTLANIKNSGLRPSYNLAQMRILDKNPKYDLNKLTIKYQEKEMSVVDAQKLWDDAEIKKINMLEKYYGKPYAERIVANVYGTGQYEVTPNAIHQDIDDGFQGTYFTEESLGSYDEAEARFKQLLIRAGMSEDRTEALSLDSVNLLLDSGALDEKQLFEGYERGFIPDVKVTSETGGTPYMYKGETIMKGAEPATFDYRWYDPRTGAIYDKNYNKITKEY
tara:strand:+ start:1484 stop:3268 length:1785 start_codon:yes stop_codon:yes gene_type:complete